MDADLIIITCTLMLTVIGTGVALAAAIMPSLRDLRRKVDNLARDHGERLASIETALHVHGMNGGGIRRVYVTDEAPPEEPEAQR